jgi:hypothetical protein
VHVGVQRVDRLHPHHTSGSWTHLQPAL